MEQIEFARDECLMIGSVSFFHFFALFLLIILKVRETGLP